MTTIQPQGRYYFVIRDNVSKHYNVPMYSSILGYKADKLNLEAIPHYLARRLMSLSDYVIFANDDSMYYLKNRECGFGSPRACNVDPDEFTFIRLASVELGDVDLPF